MPAVIFNSKTISEKLKPAQSKRHAQILVLDLPAEIFIIIIIII